MPTYRVRLGAEERAVDAPDVQAVPRQAARWFPWRLRLAWWGGDLLMAVAKPLGNNEDFLGYFGPRD